MSFPPGPFWQSVHRSSEMERTSWKALGTQAEVSVLSAPSSPVVTQQLALLVTPGCRYVLPSQGDPTKTLCPETGLLPSAVQDGAQGSGPVKGWAWRR